MSAEVRIGGKDLQACTAAQGLRERQARTTQETLVSKQNKTNRTENENQSLNSVYCFSASKNNQSSFILEMQQAILFLFSLRFCFGYQP